MCFANDCPNVNGGLWVAADDAPDIETAEDIEALAPVSLNGDEHVSADLGVAVSHLRTTTGAVLCSVCSGGDPGLARGQVIVAMGDFLCVSSICTAYEDELLKAKVHIEQTC